MEQKTFSREALYELVWSTPLLSLSKQYGISYNDLRKVCLRMKIPMPGNGHWQRMKFGKAVQKPPLHYPYTGENEIDLTTLQKALPKKCVPGTVTKPAALKPVAFHPLVKRSKEALEKSEPDNYRFLGMVSCGDEALDMKVTKKNIGRALRFMDNLIRAMEATGYSLELQNGRTYVHLSTDEFRIQLREQTTRLPETEQAGFTKYQSTGKLAFSVGIGHLREFRDGSLTLEEQLPKIMEHLEVVDQEWSTLRRSQQLKKELEQQEERLQQEASALKEKELADFNSLLEKAERWHKSDNLRRYIDEVERRGSAGNELQVWVEWARKKADWYDPFVEKEDAFLTEGDYNPRLL